MPIPSRNILKSSSSALSSFFRGAPLWGDFGSLLFSSNTIGKVRRPFYIPIPTAHNLDGILHILEDKATILDLVFIVIISTDGDCFRSSLSIFLEVLSAAVRSYLLATLLLASTAFTGLRRRRVDRARQGERRKMRMGGLGTGVRARTRGGATK